MGKEIERKFLVRNDDWRAQAIGTRYRQGYLCTFKERTVRVRTVGDTGYLTIKGITRNSTRDEYEYRIPVDEANEMLDRLCERPLIDKRRHKIEHGGLVWEVDEFEGENLGLILAEVELETSDQEFALPSWVGEEVTEDPSYYNANLVSRPFTTW